MLSQKVLYNPVVFFYIRYIPSRPITAFSLRKRQINIRFSSYRNLSFHFKDSVVPAAIQAYRPMYGKNTTRQL